MFYYKCFTSKDPKKHAIKASPTLSATFKSAAVKKRCSIQHSVSKLKVEQVVRPPNKPAVKKDFKFGFDST